MQRFVRAILRKWSVHLHRGRLQPKKYATSHSAWIPFFVDAIESIVDGERLLFIADDPSVHPRIVFIVAFARVKDILTFPPELRDDPPTRRPSRAQSAFFPSVFFHRHP